MSARQIARLAQGTLADTALAGVIWATPGEVFEAYLRQEIGEMIAGHRPVYKHFGRSADERDARKITTHFL
jgi:hypothetical protein